jgi:photosystem II stability/assembly factor-like uncharacterized protein
MRGLILAWCAAALVGCEPELVYMCRDDAACDTAPGGACRQGYCAFPDPSCGAGGLKWDSSAAALAGLCVPPAGNDAGVDAAARDLSTSDGTVDAAMPDMTHVLTWTPQVSGTGALLSDIWGSGPTDIYIVGSGGTILHSSDGNNWRLLLNSPTLSDLDSVWGSSANDVYVVGASGEIWRTADQGGTWTRQPSGTTVNLYRVWGSSGGDIYAVGSTGTVLHTTNSGTTWNGEASSTTQDLYAVWGTTPMDVYAAGTSATIIHFGGNSWSTQRMGNISDRLYSITRTQAGDLFASYPGILLTSAGNGIWSDITTNLKGAQVGRLWNSGSDLWGVQSVFGQSILHSANNGATWDQTPSNAPIGLLAIWGTSSTNIYAVGGSGAIVRGQ